MSSRVKVPAGMMVAGKMVRPKHAQSIRFYRIALVASRVLNALLVAAFWLYVHFAGTLSMIEDVVGFFN
jgi:hypothetical protein